MQVTSCDHYRERFGDYVDDRLSADERGALEEHVRSCPRCRDDLASYRALPEVVRRITDVTMPAAARARLARLLRSLRRR